MSVIFLYFYPKCCHLPIYSFEKKLFHLLSFPFPNYQYPENVLLVFQCFFFFSFWSLFYFASLFLHAFLITLLLFNYSCLHFLPTTPQPTPAKPTSLPFFHPPARFCPCVLYSSSSKPFSALSPHSSPLAIVRLFLISMSLVIFYLLFSFLDYFPVKGEILRKPENILLQHCAIMFKNCPIVFRIKQTYFKYLFLPKKKARSCKITTKYLRKVDNRTSLRKTQCQKYYGTIRKLKEYTHLYYSGYMNRHILIGKQTNKQKNIDH